ncbi:MAG: type II toxin-antitoxin system VapC family toxin [Acidobacteriota bacterium]
MGLIADLGRGPVAVDTAVFIYLIEEDPRFLPHILPLFRAADQGRRTLVTSALALLEVLVVPYRAGNRSLAERYEHLLTRSRGIRMVELTRDQLRAAAQLRAATGVKTPDALHLVSALGAGCATFVTNDRRLPSIPGLRVIQLSSYLEAR